MMIFGLDDEFDMAIWSMREAIPVAIFIFVTGMLAGMYALYAVNKLMHGEKE